MGLIEQVKDVAKLAHDVQNIPLYEKLVSMQAEILGLVEENARLRQENRALSEALSLRDELEFEDNLYWRIDGSGRAGPFCPRCVDVSGKAVRMLTFNSYSGQPVACAACGLIVATDGGFIPPVVIDDITAQLPGQSAKRR